MLQSLVNWLIPSFTKRYPIFLSFLSYSNWGWNKGLEGQTLIGWLWGWLYYLFAIFKSRSLRMSYKKKSKWPKVSVFSSIYLANFDNVLNIKKIARLCTKFQSEAKSKEGFFDFIFFHIFYNKIWLNFLWWSSPLQLHHKIEEKMEKDWYVWALRWRVGGFIQLVKAGIFMALKQIPCSNNKSPK